MSNCYKKTSLPSNFFNISDGITASKALVYEYKQGTHNYIIKAMAGMRNINALNHVITEVKIYNYVNTLQILKVCDHIVLHYDAAIYQDRFENKTFLMVNETSVDGEEVVSLENFINNISRDGNNVDTYMSKVLPTLLFKLMYTLECLVRAKVKHNDLHLGNVLVFKSKTNIIIEPTEFTLDKLKYDKYVVTSRTNDDYFGPDNDNDKALYKSAREPKNIYQKTVTYYVPDYGFKIKIFDFDRSCVYDKNNKLVIYDDKIYNTPIQHTKYIDYKCIMYGTNKRFYSDNTIPYEYIDLYKIFGYILNTISIKKHQNYNSLIDKLFGTDKNNIMKKLYNEPYSYNNIENYPNFFEKETVYELLTHIFNSSDTDYSIFNFTTLVPDKTKIHNTFTIANITPIWGSIVTDVLNTQQPLETGIPIYKSVRRTLKVTLKKSNKSKYHPVSTIVNREPRVFDHKKNTLPAAATAATAATAAVQLSINTSNSEGSGSSKDSGGSGSSGGSEK